MLIAERCSCLYDSRVQKTTSMNKQIWIGLAEVQPLPGCKLLEEARGAYVHVMAWGNNPEEFRTALELRARELALEIVNLRETEPWQIRSSGELPLREEFFEMESRIHDDVCAVAFGRFHAWLKDQPVG